MKLRSISPIFLILQTYFDSVSSHGTRYCNGCPSASTLRQPAYGIDLSTDYLTIAIQHVNGTLSPIASLNASSAYHNLMLEILSSAPVHPYGHRSIEEKPSPDTSDPSQNIDHIAVFKSEIKSLLTSIAPQIEHYFLSVPMYFTPSTESLVLSALSSLGLPKPISTITADSSAFLTLKRAHCENFVDCKPVDKEKHVLLFVEYSKSTMSAAFMSFWGGWFLTPHAYCVDVELGDGKKEDGNDTDEEHWKKIEKRIDDLIHDYEDALFEHPSSVSSSSDSSKFNLSSLKLIILGSHGTSPPFQTAVERALKNHATDQNKKFTLNDVRQEGNLDPMFLPAMGIAREAKDRIDKRGIMAGCNRESEKCKGLRELVVREAMVGKGFKDYRRWRDEL